MEKVIPLEDIDPELGKLLQDIANKRLDAAIINGKVFKKNNHQLIEIVLDLQRNDPCICGSGKKFKKCCIDKI